MKLAKSTISGASLLLLAIQLALVCSVAATYLYQRWTYPRVWTRTVGLSTPIYPCAAATSACDSPSTAAKARCPRASWPCFRAM